MSVKDINRDELKERSMIEIGTMLLKDEKKTMHYRTLFDQVAEIKGFTQEQKDYHIAQFYTDLNLDGRFLFLGQGEWGLKAWYPVEQIDEEVTQEPKKKKKKKKKATKKEVAPSIDDVDEDLTEIPLGFIEKDLSTDDDDDDDDDDLDLDDDDDLFDDDDDDEDYDDDDEDDDSDNDDADDDKDTKKDTK